MPMNRTSLAIALKSSHSQVQNHHHSHFRGEFRHHSSLKGRTFREREREREIDIHTYIYTYKYTNAHKEREREKEGSEGKSPAAGDTQRGKEGSPPIALQQRSLIHGGVWGRTLIFRRSPLPQFITSSLSFLYLPSKKKKKKTKI